MSEWSSPDNEEGSIPVHAAPLSMRDLLTLPSRVIYTCQGSSPLTYPKRKIQNSHDALSKFEICVEPHPLLSGMWLPWAALGRLPSLLSLHFLTCQVQRQTQAPPWLSEQQKILLQSLAGSPAVHLSNTS